MAEMANEHSNSDSDEPVNKKSRKMKDIEKEIQDILQIQRENSGRVYQETEPQYGTIADKFKRLHVDGLKSRFVQCIDCLSMYVLGDKVTLNPPSSIARHKCSKNTLVGMDLAGRQVEWLASNRGNLNMLVIDGYIFTRNKVNGIRQTWKCNKEQDKKIKCPVRAATDGDVLVRMSNKHNHKQEEGFLVRKKINCDLKIKAAEELEKPTKDVYNDVVAAAKADGLANGFTEEQMNKMIPTYENSRSTIQKARQKAREDVDDANGSNSTRAENPGDLVFLSMVESEVPVTTSTPTLTSSSAFSSIRQLDIKPLSGHISREDRLHEQLRQRDKHISDLKIELVTTKSRLEGELKTERQNIKEKEVQLQTKEIQFSKMQSEYDKLKIAFAKLEGKLEANDSWKNVVENAMTMAQTIIKVPIIKEPVTSIVQRKTY